MLDVIGKSLDQKLTVKAAFLDIAKAFDHVWHQALLHKLWAKGIRGDLHKWLVSYLTGRVQQVTIRGAVSKLMSILAGVPQGSILGPLLFLIFIDDVTSVIDSYIRLFADDTMMMSIGATQYHCINSLQPSLDAFTEWARVWKVGINPTKTQVITFTRSTMPHASLYMNGVELEECFSHKHVGVHLQSDLKWSTHINSLIDQAESRLAIMKYHRFNFSKKTFKNHVHRFYTSYIRICLSSLVQSNSR